MGAVMAGKEFRAMVLKRFGDEVVVVLAVAMVVAAFSAIV